MIVEILKDPAGCGWKHGYFWSRRGGKRKVGGRERKKEGLERSFYVKTGIGVQDATVSLVSQMAFVLIHISMESRMISKLAICGHAF